MLKPVLGVVYYTNKC